MISFVQKFREFKSEIVTEFYSHIDRLLEHDQVRDLDNYIQHYCYTRLQHSLDVAYYSFIIARLLHWDSRSTARAALLHDLYHYDNHDDAHNKNHASNHPQIALDNAREVCEDLNNVEADIIKKHMWLITLIPPRYKEGFVVTFVDKFCATKEFFTSLFSSPGVRTVYVNEA